MPGAPKLQIQALTSGTGADYTFEATGNVRVMAQAVAAARMGWGAVRLCGIAGHGEVMEIVPRLLVTGRRVTGCEIGGLRTRSEIPSLVERWLDGELDPQPLISAHLALDEINSAFERMRQNQGLRSVITFD